MSMYSLNKLDNQDVNNFCMPSMLILVGGYFLLFNGVVWDFVRRKTLLWIQKHGTDIKSHENGGQKTKPPGKQGVNGETVNSNSHTKCPFAQLLVFQNLAAKYKYIKVYIFDTITHTSLIFMHKP